MKLPLFHIQSQFKDLFKEMDTEYQKNEVNVWNFQGDSILDRIIKEGEVIVEEGDISNYIEDDGFFRVEGKLVLVYIRDQFIRRNPYNDSYDQEITEEYNITTVINTHDMNSVMEIGKKIVFLQNGKKAWEGTKEDIFNTDNKAVSNFVYSSDLFKKVREVYLKT